MKGVIYSFTVPQTGKMYIGQTLYLQRKRIDKHKYDAFTKKTDTAFARAIRKYGWDDIKATYTVIEEIFAENRQELKNKLTDREIYYIQKFNTFLPGGYNLNESNQRKFSDYKRKKEMYEKISASLKGKYLNELNPGSKQVINYDTKIVYPSISEAARKTGIYVQEICRVLKSKGLTAGGYRWCYVVNGQIDTSNLRKKNRKNLPVYCVELDKTFISAYEAAKFIGKPQGKANIRLACQNSWKSYGYTWIYKG